MKNALTILVCGAAGMFFSIKLNLGGPAIITSLLIIVGGINSGFLYLKKLEADREISILKGHRPRPDRKTVA